jgi:hypothetical protein
MASITNLAPAALLLMPTTEATEATSPTEYQNEAAEHAGYSDMIIFGVVVPLVAGWALVGIVIYAMSVWACCSECRKRARGERSWFDPPPTSAQVPSGQQSSSQLETQCLAGGLSSVQDTDRTAAPQGRVDAIIKHAAEHRLGRIRSALEVV